MREVYVMAHMAVGARVRGVSSRVMLWRCSSQAGERAKFARVMGQIQVRAKRKKILHLNPQRETPVKGNYNSFSTTALWWLQFHLGVSEADGREDRRSRHH